MANPMGNSFKLEQDPRPTAPEDGVLDDVTEPDDAVADPDELAPVGVVPEPVGVALEAMFDEANAAEVAEAESVDEESVVTLITLNQLAAMG